jgi:hypothetical protein
MEMADFSLTPLGNSVWYVYNPEKKAVIGLVTGKIIV